MIITYIYTTTVVWSGLVSVVVKPGLFFAQGSAMIDIVSVRQSDAGRYTCVADSGADRATDILELVGK